MAFSYQDIDLPIVEVIPNILTQLTHESTLVVNAPPGAGKSTLLPLALLELDLLKDQKIIVLEPRRLAARSIAKRMAELLNEQVGETVGYRIRFESVVSRSTRIEVVTEGILTRMLQHDSTLEEVGAVIFDEFHERSIHADTALAFCRESQQVIREDLRIVIMSATLNTEKLSKLLKCKSVVSKGRQYPVDIQYGDGIDVKMIPELVANKALQVIQEYEGDVLIFLPGQGEIKRCQEILTQHAKNCFIAPLYGALSYSLQQKAIFPDRNGKRKIVLATNIAETSLTIEGIKIVIDSGFARILKFNPRSGLTRLETVLIDQDAADQRAGRAGRLSNGTCFRMWSKATHYQLLPHRIPEILETELSSLYLNLIKWGISDPASLTWLDLPPSGNVEQAKEALTLIGAIENDTITDHGIQIQQLPCHPRTAHMLLTANEENIIHLACDLAAVLEERDPMPKETGIDLNIRLDTLRRLRKEKRLSNRFAQIEKVSASYRKLFEVPETQNQYVNPYETGYLVASMYPERIAFNGPGNNAQFQLANGRYAMAGHKDDLAHEEWLAVSHLDARDGMGKIHLASPINPLDLKSMVKQVETVTWDVEDGLIGKKELRIGNIVLQQTPIQQLEQKQVEDAILTAIKKEGLRLLNLDDPFVQFQHRISSLRTWNKEETWPDFSDKNLLNTVDDWLSPYLTDVKKAIELKRLNISEMLTHQLSFEQQELLKKLAPERIKVPSGSWVKVSYAAKGKPPVLAVRIQELFGLADTPLVNNGKEKVLLHLLSPGFKPVQVTTDLNSFWNSTYHEVKKELKRRYPKHSWPEDPWTEEAVRGVKRKKDR